VREIAEEFPRVRISVLAENKEQVRQWHGSRIEFFDINPGMNRTGIEQSHGGEVVELVKEITTVYLSSAACITTMASMGRRGASTTAAARRLR
jgi:hypothetical protein